MSDFGVEPDDMKRAVMIDDKLDALLAGRKSAPGDGLTAELSNMLGQLHQAFPPIVVSEQVEDAHVARMLEAAASLPAVETAATVALQTPLLERMRAGLSRRVAVATVALTTAFGGAAYAGVLPEPIQRAVAEVAAIVGLDLPDASHGVVTRLSVPDGDEGGDGVHGTERGQEPGSLGGTRGEGPRDGDTARGGAPSGDRDQRDDSDPESNDGNGDNDTGDNDTDDIDTDDNETDDNDNETDNNETDDLPDEDDEPDDGDRGEAEEPDSEDSNDEVKDEDATEGSSDSSSGSGDAEAEPVEVQD